LITSLFTLKDWGLEPSQESAWFMHPPFLKKQYADKAAPRRLKRTARKISRLVAAVKTIFSIYIPPEMSMPMFRMKNIQLRILGFFF
jgi:hypothetical protein